MAQLADHLGLDRSTVSGLVDRAAARGLVERVPDPDDGRASRVRLTPAGRALSRRLTGQTSAGLSPLVSRVPAGEGSRLAERLLRLLR